MLKEIPPEIRKFVLSEFAAGLADARTDAIKSMTTAPIADPAYSNICAYYKGVINSLDEQMRVLDEIINRKE